MRWLVAALLWVCGVLSCVPPEDTEPTATPTPERRDPSALPGRDRHPTWAMRSRESFGVAVQIPSSWSLAWNPLRDGTVGDILVAGSWRFPDLPECEPIPPGQALVSLSEVVPPVATADYTPDQLDREFPPRPRRFETTVLRSLGVRKGCDQPKAQLFRFRDAGRFLYAWAMFGRDLPTRVRTKAEAVLSTLRVIRTS